MLHRKAIYFITKSNFYGANLPPPLNFPNFWVTIWGLGAKISAYHINMQGVDRHRICFFVFAGSKKCTRDGFACCHPERSEGSPPSQPKDNVLNLVIARRALPDVAISFAQCVMLSSAKHLLAGRLRGDSSLHSEWQHRVPLLIANYSLLIIIESRIAPRHDSP